VERREGGEWRGKKRESAGGIERIEWTGQEGVRIKKFACNFCADLHCDGGKGLVGR
jgi:hypothetical protein